LYAILLGLPGAGKGTQASRLIEHAGLAHVATGDLFRRNMREGTELGKKAQSYVEGGLLVPDEITIGMLLERISEPDCANGCMFDGFPRNTEQAVALDDALGRRGKQIDRAIYIRVSTNELVGRLAGRWSCPECSAVYHETSKPPEKAGICDNCGAQLQQRVDDRPDVVRTRLEVNLRNLQPLLAYYGDQRKLFEVNGEQEVDDVSGDIRRLLKETECLSS
jgi:adenylate kinase